MVCSTWISVSVVLRDRAGLALEIHSNRPNFSASLKLSGVVTRKFRGDSRLSEILERICLVHSEVTMSL